MGDLFSASAVIREYSLGLPGTTEAFPWGERVLKVDGKVFVFMGMAADTTARLSLSLKLPQSGPAALESGFGKPTGYGLGKSGWVSLAYEPGDRPEVATLLRWVEESYRAVAKKKRLAELDAAR